MAVRYFWRDAACPVPHRARIYLNEVLVWKRRTIVNLRE